MQFLLGYILGLVTMFIVVSYYLRQASEGKMYKEGSDPRDNED